uniref:Uncharacterized protein n=1 Tax=Knipowitschia caucasica TaxID=637954 RepID=A0AAV2MPH3_KNICA
MEPAGALPLLSQTLQHLELLNPAEESHRPTVDSSCSLTPPHRHITEGCPANGDAPPGTLLPPLRSLRTVSRGLGLGSRAAPCARSADVRVSAVHLARPRLHNSASLAHAQTRKKTRQCRTRICLRSLVLPERLWSTMLVHLRL